MHYKRNRSLSVSFVAGRPQYVGPTQLSLQTNRPTRAFLSQRRSIKSREEERIRSPFAAMMTTSSTTYCTVRAHQPDGEDVGYKRGLERLKEIELCTRCGLRRKLVIETELIRVNSIREANYARAHEESKR